MKCSALRQVLRQEWMARTIDFAKMEEQIGDETQSVPFSFTTDPGGCPDRAGVLLAHLYK